MLIRLSILFFYIRIFVATSLQVAIRITIVFVITSTFALVIATSLQCTPIAAAFDKSIPHKCLDINSLAYSGAGLGIAQDFIILFLPLPELYRLRMSTKKKLLVMSMFLIGIIASATSIVRVFFLSGFGTSLDPTWDNQTGALWSLGEQSAAIICACLPAIRKLLSQRYPHIFEIEDSRNQNHPQSLPRFRYPFLSLLGSFGSKNSGSSMEGENDEFRLVQDLGSPFRVEFDLEAIAPRMTPAAAQGNAKGSSLATANEVPSVGSRCGLR